jgi:hypothetical protein
MKISKLLALILILMPFTVFAENFYVGAGYQESDIEIDDGFYNDTGITGSTDRSSEGFRIIGGYNITPKWSLEIGYADYGDAQYSGPGFGFETQIEAVHLNGYYHWNPAGNDKFTIDFMAGVQRARGEGRVTELLGDTCEATLANFPQIEGLGCGSTETIWGVNAGLGATVHLNKRLGIKAMVETSSIEFEETATGGEKLGLFESPTRAYIDVFLKF